MALKNNKKIEEEELPFPVDIVDEDESEQISFDDIEFEADYEDPEDRENEVYLTISGKEQQYEPEWEVFGVNDLDIGAIMTGRPEITIFENKDKSYNALRLRVLDDGEILNLYLNFPKKDYPRVKRLNKDFNFYRPLFDFVFNVLRMRDERNVVKNGEEINIFKTVNLEMLAKYVDQHERVGVKVIKGYDDPNYNSWIIYKLE